MMQNETPITPGPIIFFGSGETLPSSSSAYVFVARKMTNLLDISLLETPADFQNISEIVSKIIADFIEFY